MCMHVYVCKVEIYRYVLQYELATRTPAVDLWVVNAFSISYCGVCFYIIMCYIYWVVASVLYSFCIRLSSISEGLCSHINSVWPVFLFEQLCLQLFLKIHIDPQLNPHFGLFLSLNMCCSYKSRLLYPTISDMKTIQELSEQFKSLRDDVDTLKKHKSKKSKKSKRKSYSRSCSRSRDRCYHSWSRATSNSPWSRDRSTLP